MFATNTTIIFADSAVNWWVVATLASVAAFVMSLLRGSFLRNGLINIFVGLPASFWMLATFGAISSGGSFPLFLSLALVLGHLGLGASNLLAASSGALSSSSSYPRYRRVSRRVR